MNPAQLMRFAAAGAGATAIAALAGMARVLGVQLMRARRRPALDPRTAPDLAGAYGERGNPTVRLLWLGDSTAASVGAEDERHALGSRVARALARDGHYVQLTSVAVPNSLTSDVKIQAARALVTSESDPYDVAVLIAGALDVCSWRSIDDISRATYRTVASLHGQGISVVVATTPDMGAVHCVHRPLRTLWGLRSRQVAEAQRAGAEAGGGLVVDLARTLGPAFEADPSLYSVDGFHPSSDGYKLIADELLPTIRKAVRARDAAT